MQDQHVNGDKHQQPKRDENIVLQLLHEVGELIGSPIHSETFSIQTESPSLDPKRAQTAARLYLNTRDTFDLIAKVDSSDELAKRRVHLQQRRGQHTRPATPRRSSIAGSHDGDTTRAVSLAERIVSIFRLLGHFLVCPILEELIKQNLNLDAVMHYVCYLPGHDQWRVYKEVRILQVQNAYKILDHNVSIVSTAKSALLFSSALSRHAEFIKSELRRDIDTICVFARNGTLSTIFAEDEAAFDVDIAEKFEGLVMDAYAYHLRAVIEQQMDALSSLSNQWQDDKLRYQQSLVAAAGEAMAAGAQMFSLASHANVARFFMRQRKFRIKKSIFPRAQYDWIARTTYITSVGAQILISHPQHVGVWWQSTVISITNEDITILHHDEALNIINLVESLHGNTYVTDVESNRNFFRRCGVRNGVFAKMIGQRLLVNNNKDSLWIEGTVLEVDDKKCRFIMKPSLDSLEFTSFWKNHLEENPWMFIRNYRWNAIPQNPDFRTSIGLNFRKIVDDIQSNVIEISSVFPNVELESHVQTALWRSLESTLSKGEHIYARYLRSVLHVRKCPSSADTDTYQPSSTLNAVTYKKEPKDDKTVSGNTRIRRLSLSTQAFHRSCSTLGLGEASSFTSFRISLSSRGSFDSSGMYKCMARVWEVPEKPDRVPGFTGTALPQSLFEDLCHHLLEETEVISVCLKANNLSLSRAFVQIFDERIKTQYFTLQSRLTAVEDDVLEYVLSEYANAHRFLHAWRICRYELDEAARQRRTRRNRISIKDLDINDCRPSPLIPAQANATLELELEWINKSFEKMDIIIQRMLQSLAYHIHHQFFHECSTMLFPGIYERCSTASCPREASCTPNVKIFLCRVRMILEYAVDDVLVEYEEELGVNERVQHLLTWMILEPFSCVASFYENMNVSKLNLTQWKIDVLYMIFEMHIIMQALDSICAIRTASRTRRLALPSHSDEQEMRAPVDKLQLIYLNLLLCVAIRSAPIDILVSAIAINREANPPKSKNVSITNLNNELLRELNTIMQPIYDTSIHPFAFRFPFSNTKSLFSESNLKALAGIKLDWQHLLSLIDYSKTSIRDQVQKRIEMSEWDSSLLTSEELESSRQIRNMLGITDTDRKN